MTHFNSKRPDEIFLKLHPGIIKHFCFIVAIFETIFLMLLSRLFWDFDFPSMSNLIDFFFEGILSVRFLTIVFMTRRSPPMPEHYKKLFFFIFFCFITTLLICNIFIIFSSYYPPEKDHTASWGDILWTISATSFTGYIALVHSIQLFRPNKRKTFIINIITSLMMLGWLINFIVGYISKVILNQ